MERGIYNPDLSPSRVWVLGFIAKVLTWVEILQKVGEPLKKEEKRVRVPRTKPSTSL